MPTFSGDLTSYPSFGRDPIVVSGYFYDFDSYNPTFDTKVVETTDGYGRINTILPIRDSGADVWSTNIIYTPGIPKLVEKQIITYPSGSPDQWFVFSQSPVRSKGAWESQSVTLRRVV